MNKMAPSVGYCCGYYTAWIYLTKLLCNRAELFRKHRISAGAGNETPSDLAARTLEYVAKIMKVDRNAPKSWRRLSQMMQKFEKRMQKDQPDAK